MSAVFLVLTADPRFCENDQSEFAYLGKWCFKNKDLMDSDHKNILPYPFDKKDKLYISYHYLQQVYQHLFPQVSQILNEIHEVDHSERFWKIVAGYWFREYIEILYERYSCIVAAAKQYPQANVSVLAEENYVTPKDSLDFSTLYVGDFYNQQLYSQIIHNLKVFSPKIKNGSVKDFVCDNDVLVPRSSSYKQLIKWVSLLLSRWNRYFVASSYLPLNTLFKVSAHLKIFPSLDTPFFKSKKSPISEKARKKFSTLEVRDEFEQLVKDTLGLNFPQVYIENFLKLKSFVSRYFPSRKVKLILTANAFAVNEAFKLWTARQVQHYQTPFVIMQHGGNYGCAQWNSSEDYETDISDWYLSYGWKDRRKNKIIPFLASRLSYLKKSIKNGNKEGKIIWVLCSFPRYAYAMYSVPVGPQFEVYLQEQQKFVVGLSLYARSLLYCKPYFYEYGWSDINYIESVTGKVQMASQRPLWKQFKNSRLVVCTYNATVHLEAFGANIPTIMFWNPEHWLLREEAKPYYEEMIKLGILHHSPESAALKVNEVAVSTFDWWHGTEIQSFRARFRSRFANTEKEPVGVWVKELKRLATG